MRLTIELTDFQRAVIGPLASGASATAVADLLAEAIAFDAARPVEARWREPRPQSPRRPQRRAARARLDVTLAPATGRALLLAPGDRLTIEQLADGQCVDLTACEPRAGRRFSAARTRAEHGIHPSSGDVLWSGPPELPLLRILTDTAPGHDLCFPPCTAFEYEQLTGIGGHRGCHDLLVSATRRWLARHAPDAVGGQPVNAPEVLNLWLPSEVTADSRLLSWPVACRRGDAIELEALTDVLVTLSTCPDDLYGSGQYAPGPVRLILDGPGSEPVRTSRATAPPRSAAARHAITVALPDPLAEHLDRVRATAWLGTSRPAVARALLFRWYEATRPAITRPRTPPARQPHPGR